MMPKTSPFSISRLTRSTATVGASPRCGAGYSLVTSFRAMWGMG
ncbi:hypothetical protein ACFFX0_19250 [Citricoccus parietis]|uniref:Uncharacterized protein n=1 Tax=Citricoccus parietis TaxID=592307 RepID=A0ABV5G2Q6_9MICC